MLNLHFYRLIKTCMCYYIIIMDLYLCNWRCTRIQFVSVQQSLSCTLVLTSLVVLFQLIKHFRFTIFSQACCDFHINLSFLLWCEELLFRNCKCCLSLNRDLLIQFKLIFAGNFVPNHLERSSGFNDEIALSKSTLQYMYLHFKILLIP